MRLKKAISTLISPRKWWFFLQRRIMHFGVREFLADGLVYFLPKKECRSNHSPEILERAKQLNQYGFVSLGKLALEQEVREVRDHFNNKKMFDRWGGKQRFFTLGQRPPECHTALYCTEDLISAPHLLAWANRPEILAIVESMLGAKPTISNVSLWWSFAGHAQPQQAEFFHRDVDDLRFVKLFVYLTDVDDLSGPHIFMRGSHHWSSHRKIRRYQDDEVLNMETRADYVRFVDGAGSAFIENTFGLHKGTLVEERDRLLFQVQYSLLPIGLYDYQPLEISEQRKQKINLDPYINRLYVI